jgi:hypothetical protein
MIEQTNERGEQLLQVRKQVRHSKPNSKKLYVFISILLLLVVAGSVFSVTGYNILDARYHNDQSLAQTSIQDLRKAEALLAAYRKNFFDDRPVNQARQEFANALPTFEQLATDLKSLPEISTSVPVYGTRLSIALQLVSIAIEVSQAGLLACNTLDLLIARFHNPISSKEQSLSMADLNTVIQNFNQIEMVFNRVVGQLNQIQQGIQQLDPHLTEMLGTFEKEIPNLQASLNTVGKLLPIVPTLLGIGTPTNYLVEILDSTELRPGGGFVGNYGIATVSKGRLTTANLTDTYLLDKPFVAAGHSTPFPAAYSWFGLSSEGWGLRDSNLDADFPTDARNAEKLYTQEGGVIAVQGVIAITPALIQHALEITGPISVPEYHETVTAQNLIDRIHYYQLVVDDHGQGLAVSPDGHSSVRKNFTALLAEHFMARVHQLPSSEVSKFIQLLVSGLHSKDVQVYLNQSIAENILHQLHLDGAIQQLKGDGLFIVDANIAGNKANGFITNTMNDQVVIDASGNATHHTTISYAWKTSGQIYGSPIYRDYVRVFAPSGSILQRQDGWQARGTSVAFGHKVWAGLFTLSYSQTRTITLVWTVPATAKKDAQGWHYQDMIQKQAGTRWMMNLQVTLPACTVTNSHTGGLISSNKHVASFAQSLNEDTNSEIGYTC